MGISGPTTHSIITSQGMTKEESIAPSAREVKYEYEPTTEYSYIENPNPPIFGSVTTEEVPQNVRYSARSISQATTKENPQPVFHTVKTIGEVINKPDITIEELQQLAKQYPELKDIILSSAFINYFKIGNIKYEYIEQLKNMYSTNEVRTYMSPVQEKIKKFKPTKLSEYENLIPDSYAVTMRFH